MTFNSDKYWEDRYKNGGNSGVASYGIYAEFKSDIINNTIKEYNIQNMCELGCGEGEHLNNITIDYTGYDVSKNVIDRNIKKYKGKNNLLFTNDLDSINSKKFELTLSMDVILHLINDDVYYSYINNLFMLSDKYVIIYENDNDYSIGMAKHNKYRKFSNDIPKNFKLINKINNPYKGKDTKADFYIFQKI